VGIRIGVGVREGVGVNVGRGVRVGVGVGGSPLVSRYEISEAKTITLIIITMMTAIHCLLVTFSTPEGDFRVRDYTTPRPGMQPALAIALFAGRENR